MRSEPAECSCCWELRTGTTTSEIFIVSHAPTTPCMCVSVGAAEHSPPDWGPCWQQQEAGVGSRGKSSSLPDRAPGNVRWRPLSTHCPPVLLAAKREDETRAKQNNPDRPDKTVPWVFWNACPDVFRQHKANANARQGSATPLRSAKCSLEKPKAQARSSMAQKRLWYRVTDCGS